MLIINSDASHTGGIGVTVRDAAGVLLAAYSYQLWVNDMDTNDLECKAVVSALQLTPSPCVVYTDSLHATRWYNQATRVKATHYTEYLRDVLRHTYVHAASRVQHVHREDDYQRYADFASKLRGDYVWDTPTKLAEFNELYRTYKFAPSVYASRKQTSKWFADPKTLPLP